MKQFDHARRRRPGPRPRGYGLSKAQSGDPLTLKRQSAADLIERVLVLGPAEARRLLALDPEEIHRAYALGPVEVRWVLAELMALETRHDPNPDAVGDGPGGKR